MPESIMLPNKKDYKKCKLEMMPHIVKRSVERNFPISKIRDIIFKGKWRPHILEERVTCMYKNGTKYWTVILVPWKCHIFIITAFESGYSEVKMYKSLFRWVLNMVKCPVSKHEMKIDYMPMTFKVNPDVIVQNVMIHKCVACGFESIPEDEYERVRKKVHEISKVGKGSIVVTKIERRK